jgi:hypothetical protein
MAEGNRPTQTIKLIVIPKPLPGTRTVFDRQGEGGIVFDAADGPEIVMVCGNCGAQLVRGMRADQLRNIVMRCNGCGSYNETTSPRVRPSLAPN